MANNSKFDCFDAAILGLAMDTNMKVSLYLMILPSRQKLNIVFPPRAVFYSQL